MSLLRRMMGLFSAGDEDPEQARRPEIPPPTVLFADPEPNMLEAHRRMLRSLRPAWKPLFSRDGPGAITQLAATPVDVLVTEIGLPCKDGADLLASVQQLFPGVIRIALSSETDAGSDSILRSTQSAHQFLVKPCSSDFLIGRIEHAIELRLLFRHPELTRVIGGLPHLPSLPPIYHELVRALSSPDSSMDQIGEIISRDVSMTGRVLHLVNSAFFGLPRRVTSPREAAALLGVNTLKSLVLYVKLFFAAPDSPLPGFALQELWSHSSLTGRLAREIVRTEGKDRQVQEEALLAGILHDIGKLLILDAPAYLKRLEPYLIQGESSAAVEYREFSTSHAEIGAYLLGLWGLPDLVVEAVALHHRPGQIFQSEFSVVTAVHVANALLSASPDHPPILDEAYLARLGVADRVPAWQSLAEPLLVEARAAQTSSPKKGPSS